MNPKLSKLVKALESLRETIDNSNVSENGFQAHGWNQVHLNKDHLSNLIYNLITKIQSYGSAPITENLDKFLDSHIEQVTALDSTVKGHFTNNGTHLIHTVPNITITILTLYNDIEFELFSYENIQDVKMLPRSLASRLRGVKANVSALDESSSELKKKIAVINDAHEAANSLPTDLASLREARKDLTTLLENAQSELSAAKSELQALKNETSEYRNKAKLELETAEAFNVEISSYADNASKLVKQCDDALQITTTQGLAAGFDQKAVQLKNSIWVWIFGLLIALVSGAWIGAERVEAFTQVIDKDLTAGQAILHTVMSIFSIGGPLWLAWISTQQINQRFKLSEDYFYKATVAKSFTGFKKFAEKFDTQTEERLFNSTLDRIDEMPLRLINGKDYNSPWHDFIDSDAFKKAAAIFPNLLSEASRFANKAKLKDVSKDSVARVQNNNISKLKDIDEHNTSQEQIS